MAWLRSSGFLTCFYCGQRSQIKYNGATREFLCRSCDAVNYLDENGEITDPPVASEREDAPIPRYASAAVPSSADPEPTDDIFCATCLKNQRLFAASLAQYLPDDPSHPDYPELEKNYYRYRKSLEARYPQVCEMCAAKVDGRIRKAGYMAKTDHLRRMVERTRGRKPTRRVTLMDWASRVGCWLWWTGLGLQMLWHFISVVGLLEDGPDSPDGMRDPDNEEQSTKSLEMLQKSLGYMPSADAAIQWSVTAAVLSIWWNPHFVQVNRGFTRHLLGLTQWYSFQGLIVFFRLVFRVAMGTKTEGQSANSMLGAHALMAGLMTLIYVIAGRSIKVDTTPLFAQNETSVSPKQSKSMTRPGTDDADSLLDQLNGLGTRPSVTQSPTAVRGKHSFASPTQPRPAPPNTGLNRQAQLGSMNLGNSMAAAQSFSYSDEMDWSPTPAHPPALSSFSASAATGSSFGSRVEQPRTGGAFWAKVPPAPANPAQRLRNPPKPPPVVEKPPKEENVFFTPRQKTRHEAQADDMVSFKQPSFFAPEQGSEEANSLADLLSQSFSIREDEEPAVGPQKTTAAAGAPTPMTARAITLAVLLMLWLLVCFVPVPYSAETRIAIMGLSGTIAIQITGDTSHNTRQNGSPPGLEAYAASAVAAAELATICWVGWEGWKGEIDVRMYGVGVLATMLGHQVWNTARSG
ncbi:Ima1 N-terminal domain-containing protein [Stachybotrys elegans]|uniref:Ima1 N-terminal domain-containing protein n=1 Tax=Stachybotrys elegans TaxID=80388 RepID=A0A8K0SXW5_9HYPO|nr:Ima1 N-terminal domain-containing protein [Stachybotrys elegans]